MVRTGAIGVLERLHGGCEVPVFRESDATPELLAGDRANGGVVRARRAREAKHQCEGYRPPQHGQGRRFYDISPVQFE
jgi:hypothetical protein